MTGAGEDWLRDGLDAVGADFGMWLPGVDYVSGWREAREAADRLNRALLGAGFELSEVRAVASADAAGHGVVHLGARPPATGRLAGLLESIQSGEGGKA